MKHSLLMFFIMLGFSALTVQAESKPSAKKASKPAAISFKVIEYDTDIQKIGVNKAQKITAEILDAPFKGETIVIHIYRLKAGTELVGKKFYFTFPIEILKEKPNATWGFDMIASETPAKAISPDSVRTLKKEDVDRLLKK